MEYKNHYLNQVFRLAFAELDTTIHQYDVEKSKLGEILNDFTYETFEGMQSQWLKHGRMLWYISGNYSKEQAKQTVSQVVNLMNLESIPKEALSHVRLADLCSQPNNFHRIDRTVPDSNNENSCFISLFQKCLDDGSTEGRIDLLNKLVMQYLSEPTFDQLRTKEQLGYVVFTRQKITRDIQSAYFLIQSPGSNCEHIRKRMDIHLEKMRKKVREISDEDFSKVVGSVMTDIAEKDKNLIEAHTRMLNELAEHAYLFNRQDRDVALLPSITKGEFQVFFEEFFF